MNISAELMLMLANVLTSALTAITGMGGGTLLIGLLPIFLPSAAIIPVHGVTQFASNASRAYLSRSLMDTRYFVPFFVGAMVGVVVFGSVVRWVSLEWVPLFIGVYILLTQWSKRVNEWLKSFENFYIIGFIQLGMALFVGAAGPMHMPLLLKRYDNAHQAITVASVMMAFLHGCKVLIFVYLGFAFWDYWRLMLLMIVGAVIGSYLGTRYRDYVPAALLKRLLPWLLSVLAIKIIVDVLRQQLG